MWQVAGRTSTICRVLLRQSPIDPSRVLFQVPLLSFASWTPSCASCGFSLYCPVSFELCLPIMVFDDGKAGSNHVNVEDLDVRPDVTDGAVDEKLGTRYDQRDMARMNKRQELRVRWLCVTFVRTMADLR